MGGKRLIFHYEKWLYDSADAQAVSGSRTPAAVAFFSGITSPQPFPRAWGCADKGLLFIYGLDCYDVGANWPSRNDSLCSEPELTLFIPSY